MFFSDDRAPAEQHAADMICQMAATYPTIRCYARLESVRLAGSRTNNERSSQ